MSHGILYCCGAGGKRPRSRTETGTRLSGNSSAFRDPAPLGLGRGPFGVCIYQGGSLSPGILNYFGVEESRPDRERKLERDCLEISAPSGAPPLRFGSRSAWCRHLLGRVCVSWYIALFGVGGKADPVENGNWNPTVWKFQLFHGHRRLMHGLSSVRCRHLLGRVCVPWYIELFWGGGKAAPIENGNWNAIVWKFQLFQGPRPLRFGSWSVWCRHLLGRVYVPWYIELFGGGGKAAPIENGNWNSTDWKLQLLQGPRPLGSGRCPFGVGIY